MQTQHTCSAGPFIHVRFFFQAEDGIRDLYVTGVQTCALPISASARARAAPARAYARALWIAAATTGAIDRNNARSSSGHADGSGESICRTPTARPSATSGTAK